MSDQQHKPKTSQSERRHREQSEDRQGQRAGRAQGSTETRLRGQQRVKRASNARGHKGELNGTIRELELRVAYHERLNQDLSDQVYALHREVEELRALLMSVSKRLLQATGEGDLKLGPPDEAPPHY